MADDKLLLTPTQAASLLADGKYVHNFIQSSFAFIGCDYSRSDAIKAFKAAKSIEIGGDGCKSMGHGLAVFDQAGGLSFFAADKEKVAAFEAAHAKATGGAS